MKLIFTTLFLALFATLALSAAPQTPVIVSYASDTPDSVLEAAMDAIRRAGGVITHEYNLIRGFAARAPASILDTVKSLGGSNSVLVEEDQTVTANGS